MSGRVRRLRSSPWRGRRLLRAVLALVFATLVFGPMLLFADFWCRLLGWCQSECGTLTQVEDVGAHPGGLRMCVHVPAGLPPGRPLVVALHGCTQGAQEYAEQSGWIALADARQFALLLPEQTTRNNPTRCFDWFRPGDVRRHDAGGRGEAAAIQAMVQRMREPPYAIDPGRIYVTGFSAGGAMTAALLALYPEVFRGGAILAGVPFGCAAGMLDALGCMNPGRDLAPRDWAERVRAAGGRPATNRPRIAIWQGLTDPIVNPNNAGELVDEWTALLGIDRVPDQSADGDGMRVLGFADARGTVLIAEYLVPGLGHAVPIAPARGCGTPGPYARDVGVCASQVILDVWGL